MSTRGHYISGVDDETFKTLEKIRDDNGLRGTAEAIRFIFRNWKPIKLETKMEA